MDLLSFAKSAAAKISGAIWGYRNHVQSSLFLWLREAIEPIKPRA